MNIVSTIQDVRECVKAWRTEGLTVGFVPTMGFLHEGHQSLIKRAVKENDRVVVSIFVNPIQFGETEDLARYPRDLKRDSGICAELGTDLIFHPSEEEMYGEGFCTFVDMECLTNTLCGEKRPGHFRGVCTVVLKLFNIVKPDRVYFGKKDAQQLAVIRKMVRDLNIDIGIVSCEIVREADGLAMSSRNVYLNEEERNAATALPETLHYAKNMLHAGVIKASEVQRAIREGLTSEPLMRFDYAEIVDPDTLDPVSTVNKSVLVAAAVYVGQTRLIDSFTYDPAH